MNIGIIDADLIHNGNHRFPNLVCMKISAYEKDKGNEVNLICNYKDLYKDGNIWFEYQEAIKNYKKKQNSFTITTLAEKMIPCFTKQNFKHDKLFISKVFTKYKNR